MTCPASPQADDCTDQTPCTTCPTVVVDGVAWAYERAQGWHEPDEGVGVRRSARSEMTESEALETPRTPEEQPSDSTGKAAPYG